MGYFIPTMYKKNVREIPYHKLKKMGIKCLIFDLDNTLATIDEECSDELATWIQKLKEDFLVLIITNNTKKRVASYKQKLNVPIYSFALKPSIKTVSKISKEYSLKKDELCMIGDQLMTDIFLGKRFSIMTILVDPLAKKDLKITSFNRFVERIILKRYKRLQYLERGKYYE